MNDATVAQGATSSPQDDDFKILAELLKGISVFAQEALQIYQLDENAVLSMQHPPDELTTAYHEAGHTVACLALGREVEYVTIENIGDNYGQMQEADTAKIELSESMLGDWRMEHSKLASSGQPYQQRLVPALEDSIIIDYAGMYAERKFTGSVNLIGASKDRIHAEEKLNMILFGLDKQVFNHYRIRLYVDAWSLITQPNNLAAVETIALALMDKKRLDGTEALKLFNKAKASIPAHQDPCGNLAPVLSSSENAAPTEQP